MSGKLPKVSVIGGESDKISIKFFMTFVILEYHNNSDDDELIRYFLCRR